jgi:hypothetical protein
LTSARYLPAASMGWSLKALVAVMALGAGLQAEARDPSVPTAIEQALIERACSARQDPGTLEPDDHVQCLGTRLVALRADFGRNLNRLSASSRRRLDSTCGRLAIAERRESYLDCLSAQLVVLRNRSNPVPGKTSTSQEATLPALVVSASVASPPLTPQTSSWSSALVIGGTLMTTLVLSGVVRVAKSRRARRVCRVCGATVPDTGALCQTCRHDAAAALRRAAAERATRSVRDEEQRGPQRHQEEQRRLEAREDEREQLRKQEAARLLELEAAARLREKDARRLQAEGEDLRRSQATVLAGMGKEAFDPYTILGVPRDTGLEEIRSAYQEAKLKYDPDQVAHLGDEIQQHFTAKAQDVERAYQMLEERR